MSMAMRVFATPGHTAGSASYLRNGCVFTGDALFVDGCGRTDFQEGNAGAFYDSVTQKLFALADGLAGPADAQADRRCRAGEPAAVARQA